jgi:decaprenyl-phosphate phosphoribosyltransferase
MNEPRIRHHATSSGSSAVAGDGASIDPAEEAASGSGTQSRGSSDEVVADLREPRSNFGQSLVRLVRPRQWTKNLLVLAAPLASGLILDFGVILESLVALVSFILASSSVYILNDIVDRESDRRHSGKRSRPVASGRVGVRPASVIGLGCGVSALALAFTASGVALTAVLSSFLLLNVLYSVWLKHVAVVEMACIATGFALRAIGGGVASGLLVSSWFLAVTVSAAIFVTAGKRYSELVRSDAPVVRPVLEEYTASYLRSLSTIAASFALVSYSLWAFGIARISETSTWDQLTLVPFALALMRYARDIDAGQAERPEQIVTQDRWLIALGAIWVGLFIVARLV